MERHSYRTTQQIGQLPSRCSASRVAHQHLRETARPTFREASAFKKARHSKAQRRLHRLYSAAIEEQMTEEEIEENLEVSSVTVAPVNSLSGHVILPGSKSMTNRVVLLAALSEGISGIQNVLDSEDTRHMVQALRQLGVDVTADWEEKEMVIHGCGGRFPTRGGELYLGNAGTAMRPLTAAVAAAGRGDFILDGVARMRERPIQDLVDGLVALGVKASCMLKTGCPPVEIVAEGLKPGKITLSGRVSSQYLTALLMAAPLAEGEGATEIISEGLISQPYVRMTIALMKQFCVQVEELDGLNHLRIPAGQKYKSPGKIYVEGDASSASYWLAGATLTGSEITVEGCGSESLQGDVQFAKVMEAMGASLEWSPTSIKITGPSRADLKGGDFDCIDIPDAAMTLAVVGAMATAPVKIRNVGSWRVKETERMKAIVTELEKLGVKVEETETSLTVFPNPKGTKPALNNDIAIDTYDDHRMAMAFSLVSCAPVQVTINDPGCVRKTYPAFFKVFDALATYSTSKDKN